MCVTPHLGAYLEHAIGRLGEEFHEVCAHCEPADGLALGHPDLRGEVVLWRGLESRVYVHLYVCVCMCVCMYVCMYVRFRLNLRARGSRCLSVENFMQCR